MLPTAGNSGYRGRRADIAPSVIDTFFDRVLREWPFSTVSVSSAAAAFPLDVIEEDEKYIIFMDVPGITKEELDISLEGNELSIKVNPLQERDDGSKKDINYIIRERLHSPVNRVITLPSSAMSESVSAELKDGVLKIELTKKPEAKTRKIEIK